MANNLRVFNTNSEYQSADLILPAVSYVVETDKVIYDMEAPVQSKWKATYSNGNVTSAECDASSAITQGEINITNLVSVEIGNCVTSIGNMAFQECESLTSITIPDSVTSIGESAFFYCTSLANIDIPNSVTSIGRGAFVNCSSLTNIDIPNSVTSIGDAAFQQCESLTSCTIGSGVTSIGFYAFLGCSSLTSVTCLAVTPPTIVNVGLDSAHNIYVPVQSVETYKSASGWSRYARKIQPIP